MKQYLSMASIAVLLSAGAAHAEIAKDTNPDLTDNNYVSLSGTVGKILDQDEFELNYGTGTIKVDMDDNWPSILTKEGATNAATLLKAGDKVTVSGKVDKNWLTANEIDAEAVTFKSGSHLITYSKEERSENMWDRGMDYFRESGQISMNGKVTEVKNDHEFILQYGGGTIQVDTDPLEVPPSKPIAVGDTITVIGTYDKGITERNEIQATRIYRSERFGVLK